MSIKSRNKKVRICLIVGIICILLGFWNVLMITGTALAAKPGNIPVCIEFEAEGGIENDNDNPYCNDKQLKVEAIMTPDGHVNLYPNTGRGDRTLYVDVDLDGDGPITTKGWRFLVGGWNETFDMRTMDIDEMRYDVNLMINTTVPDGAPDDAKGENWRIIFDPYNTLWVDGVGSTYVTVIRTGEDTWDIQNTTKDEYGNTIPSQAILVLQTKVKNKSTFTKYEGVVTMPWFKATVTLN